MKLVRYSDTLENIGASPMKLNPETGVWSTEIPASNEQLYYRYQPTIFHPESGKIESYEVTDPYSLCLSANGSYSCVVDLKDPVTQPGGWANHASPDMPYPEDQIIYEAHIGDFSARDISTPELARGKYGAFQSADSAPMRHLSELTEAGLNTFHILPAYDIGTVPENSGEPVFLTDTIAAACTKLREAAEFCETDNSDLTLMALLERYDPLSDQAQVLVEAINEVDDFNWGYDPVHYTVPEGSYASDAHGVTRIREFRQMVQTLHEMDLRVVMDVVYNHTYKSGMDELSVLCLLYTSPSPRDA